MIQALLLDREKNELRELDAQSVLASMPTPGEAQRARDSAQGNEAKGAFHKTAPRCRAGELMWIDICDPTDEDYELLTKRFDLHAMVVEDMKACEGRPKLHDYSDYLYIIFHALDCAARAEDDADVEVENARGERFVLNVTEIDCLVGTDYVVTIHAGKLKPLEDLRARWQRRPQLMESGAAHLLYEVMDEVLDEYFPLLDTLDERIDDFEDRLFLEWQENLSADIFSLKRCLLQIRRIAGPTRDVVNILLRHDADSGGKHFAYFQDLYDHSSRIVDSVDTFRELLSGALDAYLAIASNRMNAIMKTLTSVSIILLVPTLVAGVYGMNFRHMPELESPYGYPIVLGVMASLIIGFTVYFKRKQWL